MAYIYQYFETFLNDQSFLFLGHYLFAI